MHRCGNTGARQASPRPHCDVLERFTKHRRWNNPVSRALMTDHSTRDVGRAMANCALRLKASVILQPEKEPEANLTGAMLCRQRLCPFCEWRRVKALRARLFQGLDALYEDQPKLRGVFLTLTVKNVPLEHLGDELTQMNRAWKRFTQCSFFPTDLWYRRTEVTVGSAPIGQKLFSENPGDGGLPTYAHPHFHCLLLVRPSFFSRDYIKKSEWQKQWQMALRADYSPVVDVRAAKAKSTSGSTPKDDAKSAVVEAAKYASKAAALTELGPATTELHWQLKGKRLTAMSRRLGEYVKQGDVSEEEMMDAETRPLPPGAERLEVFADWFEDIESYVITHTLE